MTKYRTYSSWKKRKNADWRVNRLGWGNRPRCIGFGAYCSECREMEFVSRGDSRIVRVMKTKRCKFCGRPVITVEFDDVVVNIPIPILSNRKQLIALSIPAIVLWAPIIILLPLSPLILSIVPFNVFILSLLLSPLYMIPFSIIVGFICLFLSGEVLLNDTIRQHLKELVLKSVPADQSEIPIKEDLKYLVLSGESKNTNSKENNMINNCLG